MQIQLAIYKADETQLLADWSNRVTSCHVRTGIHGYESCEANINIPFLEAFLYYQQLGPLKLRVSWGGNHRVWEGRLEDPTQFAAIVSGLKVTAFGGWVALNDTPYTTLWSTTDVSIFRPVLTTEIVTRFPDRFTFDTQNRISISPQKGSNQGAGIIGTITSEIPNATLRTIVGTSFDYAQLLPVGFTGYCSSFADDFTGGTVQWSLAGNAALQIGSVNITFSAVDRIVFEMVGSGAAAAFAPESGSNYLHITNLRLVTSTANRVVTTLGTNIAAGTRTVTPASMIGIYVGQRLFIDQSSVTVGESVIVTAITATTFTAVFVFAHVIASTVTAHVIYPDEIIKDCVGIVSALNPTQLSSDIALIQSQGVDLDQAIYEDQYPTEIINELLTKSDDQTPPRQWVALVYDDQRLIVRPRGTGFAWYTDITSLDVVRTLTELYNSVYAVYKDASNKRNLRTAPNTDVASVTKFQITRKKAIHVGTTSATQAGSVRDSVLALQLDPIPRAKITLDRVYDASGTPFPLHFIRADDTLTLRNLPPILGTIYDKIRTLVITRTDVDLMSSSISLELEIPMPDIGVQLTQALKGK